VPPFFKFCSLTCCQKDDLAWHGPGCPQSDQTLAGLKNKLLMINGGLAAGVFAYAPKVAKPQAEAAAFGYIKCVAH
jgi:hypothetical protein